jgi:hypothetical protein
MKSDPPPRVMAWSEVEHVSQERVWWLLRSLERDALMVIAARALANVPAPNLERVLGGYAQASDVSARVGEQEPGLLATVERFSLHARQGHFNEATRQVRQEESWGTHEFLARCRMLFERCVAEAESGDLSQVRAALDKLMELLRALDEEPDEIVQFIGEGGSWQVGIDWHHVVPAYARCVAQTANTHAEFQAALQAVIDSFVPQPAPAALLRASAEAVWSTRHAS